MKCDADTEVSTPYIALLTAVRTAAARGPALLAFLLQPGHRLLRHRLGGRHLCAALQAGLRVVGILEARSLVVHLERVGHVVGLLGAFHLDQRRVAARLCLLFGLAFLARGLHFGLLCVGEALGQGWQVLVRLLAGAFAQLDEAVLVRCVGARGRAQLALFGGARGRVGTSSQLVHGELVEIGGTAMLAKADLELAVAMILGACVVHVRTFDQHTRSLSARKRTRRERECECRASR
jgi:hypothetical protein